MAKRRKKSGPKFAQFFLYEEQSVEFRALSLAAKFTYILLKLQKNSDKNYNLTLPYSVGTKHMSKRAFSRALKELERAGFIEKTRPGGLYGRKSVFRLIRQDWTPSKGQAHG